MSKYVLSPARQLLCFLLQTFLLWLRGHGQTFTLAKVKLSPPLQYIPTQRASLPLQSLVQCCNCDGDMTHDHQCGVLTPAILETGSPVLESDSEPGGRKFLQLGAWENAYFATRSKSRQKRVNCIILANLCNL